jgi:hypothetical protein
MRCKIVRFQKLIWRNMMRLTKSKKVSILHYSIDNIKNIMLFLLGFNIKLDGCVSWVLVLIEGESLIWFVLIDVLYACQGIDGSGNFF